MKMMNNRQKTSKNTLKTGKVRVSIGLEMLKNTNFWSKSEKNTVFLINSANVRANYPSKKAKSQRLLIEI
jgi:hypothetical protein